MTPCMQACVAASGNADFKNAVEKLGFAGYMKKLANFVATGEKEYPETTEKH